METEQQQPKSDTSISPQGVLALEGANTSSLPKLPPARETESQWQRIGRQTSEFLAQLPEYLSSLFNKYRQALLTVGLILLAVVTVKILLALLDAINGIPLLAPTFELIGLGYATWFSSRYLLKASTRQELAEKIRSFQEQTLGNEVSGTFN
jgi:hypothetical protein